jgi:hypothetical protein
MRSQLHLLSLLVCSSGLAAQDAAERLTLRESALELRAVWEPLTDTVYKFEQRYPLVRELAPAQERARYTAGPFRPFLPAGRVAVGDRWRIDPAAALPFLRQFHPGATTELHHDHGSGIGAHGGWACLRLLCEQYAEVCFRVHADFLIQGDGRSEKSSWFTPAQFRGRLVVDRQRGEVVAFQLEVPPASANVDINIAEDDGVSCDIGRIPRMELAGGTAPAFPAGASQITEPAAAQLLARAFYPFAEIPWLDLAAARAESLATGKPLHVIALFGSLLDESC